MAIVNVSDVVFYMVNIQNAVDRSKTAMMLTGVSNANTVGNTSKINPVLLTLDDGVRRFLR